MVADFGTGLEKHVADGGLSRSPLRLCPLPVTRSAEAAVQVADLRVPSEDESPLALGNLSVEEVAECLSGSRQFNELCVRYRFEAELSLNVTTEVRASQVWCPLEP